jgi:Ion channel
LKLIEFYRLLSLVWRGLGTVLGTLASLCQTSAQLRLEDLALRFALSGSTITREHIYAALNAYVLAGVFAGAFYSVMEWTWPGSFAILGQSAQGQLPLSTAAYFSFVTLATLGYGDVVPVSEAARSLVVFEAIAGQLYLAVTVARLVSLYVVAELKKRVDRDVLV